MGPNSLKLNFHTEAIVKTGEPARRRKNPEEDKKLPNPKKETKKSCGGRKNSRTQKRRRKNPEEDEKLPNPVRRTANISLFIIKKSGRRDPEKIN